MMGSVSPKNSGPGIAVPVTTAPQSSAANFKSCYSYHTENLVKWAKTVTWRWRQILSSIPPAPFCVLSLHQIYVDG